MDAAHLSSAIPGLSRRSVAVEDYVKCIWTIEEAGIEPSGAAIAERMGVSAASVTGMGRKLVELGLVEQERYRPWRLTPSGHMLALEIVRHHRLLELFLSRSLGMSWDRIHEEAEVLEHHISEELEELIAEALGHPEFDPHGHPIPTRDGQMPDRPTRCILDVEAGAVATIQQVRGETPELLRFLDEHGLLVGAEVEVVAHEPVAGTTSIRVLDRPAPVVVGRDLAMRIDVDAAAAISGSGAAGEAGRAQPRVIAYVAGSVATLLAVAALVVALAGPSSAASDDDAPAAGSGANHHAAMHGGGSPDETRAAMVGDAVPAPGGPHDTDELLYPPAAQEYEPGRLREFTLDVEEREIEVAKGVKFAAWTFNGTVPGPVLRVTEGDRVRITLRNSSSQAHTLHAHGIHGSDQDGVFEVIEPGGEHTYEFIAGPAGVMPYHCHVMPLRKHIGKGLYGTLIIDPRKPRPKARELTMVMNGFDTNGDGVNEVYTVNGKAFYYAKYPIRVKRGELVRIFLTNMTENDPINSFHLHGNFFRYWPVTYENPSLYTDVVSQVQGDRGIIETRFPQAGTYMFHAHQTEFGDLGWMGFFEVVA
ncbi:MAG: multicopper oxidase, type 3 [Thermoleophilia bacterium]|nr:multicopper oxidase, type 3 [Thermoleophilia bacterium]